MDNTANKADRLKALAHQFSAISEVAADLEAIGSLDQAREEATLARSKACDSLAEAQSALAATRGTIAREEEQARVAAEKAAADLAEVRAAIAREQGESQLALSALTDSLAARRSDLDALETQIAEARRRVADFMGTAV